jgi:histidyl-tRNA synthetase
MKSQMKSADRSAARVALIVGDDELAAGAVTVRHLRETRDQQAVPRDQIVDHVRKVLS